MMPGYTNADLMQALVEMKGDLGGVKATLNDVKEQTTKTNGRVTRLEEWKGASDAVDQYKKDNVAQPQIAHADNVNVLPPVKWYTNQTLVTAVGIATGAAATVIGFIVTGNAK